MNENCKFLHPFLCQDSVDFGECNNFRCTLQHLQGTTRNRNQTRPYSTYDDRYKRTGLNQMRTRNKHYFNSRHSVNPIGYSSTDNFRSSNNYNLKQPQTDFNGTTVTKSLQEILNSINNLHMVNAFIKNKILLLESSRFSAAQENFSSDDKHAQNYNFEPNKSNHQDIVHNSHSNAYPKNY